MTLKLSILAHMAVAAVFDPFNYGVGSGNAPGLEWFKTAKFGMFMHYGPVTQWGTEISFPLVCQSFPCSPAGPNNTKIDIKTSSELAAHRQAYRDLTKTFNPTKFDAAKMASLAKAAGFKYFVYTAVHCDGFANWPSNVTSYNIKNTPFARDIYGELVTAFRAEGLRVGAYVCPSLWNNDDYWAPDAKTANGPVCQPNYDPTTNPDQWNKYLSTLHGMVGELVTLYAPDLFWFDCSNSPPRTDTRLEALLGAIRAANSDAIVVTRNGVFSDYVETKDQAEALSMDILGQPSMSAGVVYETPAVLQASRQWAYDPNSQQKNTSRILGNVVALAAKGGNYLLNVAPGPTGEWPQSAIDVLEELAAWFKDNGEAIHDTSPIYPFQQGGVYYTSSTNGRNLYAIVPQSQPGFDEQHANGAGEIVPLAFPAQGDPMRELPNTCTFCRPLVESSESAQTVTLPAFRPSLLSASVQGVDLLGFPAGAVTRWNVTNAGLEVDYSGDSAALVFRIRFAP